MTGGAATSGADEMTAGAEVTAAADERWVMAGQLVTAVPHEVIVTMRVLYVVVPAAAEDSEAMAIGVVAAEVADEMISVEEIMGVEIVGTMTAELVVGTMTTELVVGTMTAELVVGTTTADVELVVGTGAAEVEDEETTGPGFEIPN